MTDQPRLGWAWCGDVPTGGERRGDVEATQHPDDQITLAWDPDDATCTIVGRTVLDAIVAERNRLTRENREHEQRAELLRSQAAELEQERDEAIEHDRQPYPTADAYEAACRALDRHRADAAQRGAELDAARAALLEQLRVNEVLNVQRGEARAEVERLRSLLRDVAAATRGEADGTAYVDRDHDKLAGQIRDLRDQLDQAIDLGDRLRFLLAEALAEARRLDAADSGRCGPHADDPNEELDRIERAAGLT